jgi:uncharacterized OsmC-like protein
MQESLNGIDVPALQDTLAAVRRDPAAGLVHFGVQTRWLGQTRSIATVSDYTLGGTRHPRQFEITADEPPELLGTNTAPNPQELLLAALNACLTVGLVANAAARGIRIEMLEIIASGALDLRGFLGLDESIKPGYEEVRYTVRIKTNAPVEQVLALHEHVMKTSPNFSNFASSMRVVPQLEVESA